MTHLLIVMLIGATSQPATQPSQEEAQRMLAYRMALAEVRKQHEYPDTLAAIRTVRARARDNAQAKIASKRKNLKNRSKDVEAYRKTKETAYASADATARTCKQAQTTYDDITRIAIALQSIPIHLDYEQVDKAAREIKTAIPAALSPPTWPSAAATLKIPAPRPDWNALLLEAFRAMRDSDPQIAVALRSIEPKLRTSLLPGVQCMIADILESGDFEQDIKVHWRLRCPRLTTDTSAKSKDGRSTTQRLPEQTR